MEVQYRDERLRDTYTRFRPPGQDRTGVVSLTYRTPVPAVIHMLCHGSGRLSCIGSDWYSVGKEARWIFETASLFV